jgi:hypothetical protein
MPIDPHAEEQERPPGADESEPTDRDERRVKALQHHIKGAIADKQLDGTGVVRKLDAALRGESVDELRAEAADAEAAD